MNTSRIVTLIVVALMAGCGVKAVKLAASNLGYTGPYKNETDLEGAIRWLFDVANESGDDKGVLEEIKASIE